MALIPLEVVHADILARGPHSKDNHNPYFEDAVSFQNSCQAIWTSPIGNAMVRYLCAHAHPCKHIPNSDPIAAAHAAGRAEMVAFIVLTASPDDIPQLSQLSLKPTEQTHDRRA